MSCLPICTLSGPISKTPTMRPMKLRMVLKLSRPILQEPSTSSTMSAFAVVLHWASTRRKSRKRVLAATAGRQTTTCVHFNSNVGEKGVKKEMRGLWEISTRKETEKLKKIIQWSNFYSIVQLKWFTFIKYCVIAVSSLLIALFRRFFFSSSSRVSHLDNNLQPWIRLLVASFSSWILKQWAKIPKGFAHSFSSHLQGWKVSACLPLKEDTTTGRRVTRSRKPACAIAKKVR